MSGWIQAAMQQNTIIFVSALLYNTLHASVVGLLSHNFFIVTFTQQKKIALFDTKCTSLG